VAGAARLNRNHAGCSGVILILPRRNCVLKIFPTAYLGRTRKIFVAFHQTVIQPMSGALEAAASAFAVVGVADVLVRTGREFYSFLSEVADAPEEINRLREVIRTTVLLYHNSRRCQQDLKTKGASASAADVTTSLESATKALDRELRELTKTARKYNGIKTWGNVKFVLGKDRVNKAIQRLEHAKALIANALTLACMYVIVYGVHDHSLLQEHNAFPAGNILTPNNTN